MDITGTMTQCVCMCVFFPSNTLPICPYSKHRPIQKQDSIYGNWMKTMSTICDDITTESQVIEHLIYQQRHVTHIQDFSFHSTN